MDRRHLRLARTSSRSLRLRLDGRATLAAAAAAALLAGAAPASAQPPKPAEPSASSVAMADGKARFEEGLKLAEAGNHEAARLKFSQAWSVLKAPAVLYNLARAEQLSGHSIDALHHFRTFAKMTDPKIDDGQRQAASDNIAELSKKVSQIDIEAPPHARVSIDGRAVDSDLGDPVAVLPGVHVVEAISDGKVKRVTVECHAGTVAKARLVDPGAPKGNPDPQSSAPLDPSSQPADAPSSDRPRSTMGWVVPVGLGALAAAGFVTGVVFAQSSQTSKEESEDLRRGSPGLCVDAASAACKAYDDERSSAESAATVAWIGYAAGGVLLAGAIATFVLWPSIEGKGKPSTEGKPSTTGLRIVPVAGPRAGGASVHLTF